MLLRFSPCKKTGSTNSISSWNGIVVIMEESITGVVDIMFTGTSKNGNVIFAKPVKDSGARKVSLKEGFSTSGSMCSTSACFKDGEEIGTIYPGTLNIKLYSSNNVNVPSNGTYLPSLLGDVYIVPRGLDYTCVGVDDPSLFQDYLKYNEQYQGIVQKYGLKLDQEIDLVSYVGGSFKAKIVEVSSYNPFHGKAVSLEKEEEGSFNMSVSNIYAK